MNPFNDQIAVVTGAGSGIGKTVALSLAERGATVCLVERQLNALETVASSSNGAIPGQLFSYHVDLTQDQDITRLVTQLQSRLPTYRYLDSQRRGLRAWTCRTGSGRRFRKPISNKCCSHLTL